MTTITPKSKPSQAADILDLVNKAITAKKKLPQEDWEDILELTNLVEEGGVVAHNVKSKYKLNTLDKLAEKSVDKALKFNAGSTTLEELISDLAKPYLVEWLDANLPGIVRSCVDKELKKQLPR